MIFGVVGCAVKQVPLESELVPNSSTQIVYTLAEAVTVKVGNGKNTLLRAGTRWWKIGSVDQGEVFRTKDQVVVVNSFNVHEAYIVVRNRQVIGYYLPVEQSFVATGHVNLKFTEEGKEI